MNIFIEEENLNLKILVQEINKVEMEKHFPNISFSIATTLLECPQTTWKKCQERVFPILSSTLKNVTNSIKESFVLFSEIVN